MRGPRLVQAGHANGAPEPTAEEAERINAAHDRIRERYGPVNWGTPTEKMCTIWARALAAGLVDADTYQLVRRDVGAFWHMTGTGGH